jgi:hypothetical protein
MIRVSLVERNNMAATRILYLSSLWWKQLMTRYKWRHEVRCGSTNTCIGKLAYFEC